MAFVNYRMFGPVVILCCLLFVSSVCFFCEGVPKHRGYRCSLVRPCLTFLFGETTKRDTFVLGASKT